MALTTALVLGGCSAERPPPPPLPSGFTLYRGDGYTFAYPPEWTVRRETDERGHPMVRVDGPKVPPGLSQGQIRVATEAPARITFDDQLKQYRTLSMFSGRLLRADRTTKVAGAERAHRFEAVHHTKAAGGETVRLEIIDLYVLTKDNALLDFVVRAPQDGIATTRLSEVLASFHVTRGHQ